MFVVVAIFTGSDPLLRDRGGLSFHGCESASRFPCVRVQCAFFAGRAVAAHCCRDGRDRDNLPVHGPVRSARHPVNPVTVIVVLQQDRSRLDTKAFSSAHRVQAVRALLILENPYVELWGEDLRQAHRLLWVAGSLRCASLPA